MNRQITGTVRGVSSAGQNRQNAASEAVSDGHESQSAKRADAFVDHPPAPSLSACSNLAVPPGYQPPLPFSEYLLNAVSSRPLPTGFQTHLTAAGDEALDRMMRSSLFCMRQTLASYPGLEPPHTIPAGVGYALLPGAKVHYAVNLALQLLHRMESRHHRQNHSNWETVPRDCLQVIEGSDDAKMYPTLLAAVSTYASELLTKFGSRHSATQTTVADKRTHEHPSSTAFDPDNDRLKRLKTHHPGPSAFQGQVQPASGLSSSTPSQPTFDSALTALYACPWARMTSAPEPYPIQDTTAAPLQHLAEYFDGVPKSISHPFHLLLHVVKRMDEEAMAELDTGDKPVTATNKDWDDTLAACARLLEHPEVPERTRASLENALKGIRNLRHYETQKATAGFS